MRTRSLARARATCARLLAAARADLGDHRHVVAPDDDGAGEGNGQFVPSSVT